MELVSRLVVLGILILEAVIVVQGTILTSILFQKKNQNSLLLGWFILCISLNQLFEIISGYGLFEVPVPSGYFFTLCFGPLFYFYLATYFSNLKISWKMVLMNFIPAFAFFLITLFDYKLLYVKEDLFSSIVLLHLVIYLLLCYRTFRFGKSKVELKLTELRKKHIQWTKRELNLFGFICVLIISIVILKIADFNYQVVDLLIFLTYLIIIILMVIIILKLLSYPKSMNLSRNINSEELDKIRDYIVINELYKNDSLQVYDLAKEMNISKVKLSELINKSHGAPFNHFINEIRINAAQIKIANSNDQIKAVMYDVGFNSRSVFNETFKRFIGMTPLEYRKSCKDS